MSDPKRTQMGSFTGAATGIPVVGSQGDHVFSITVSGSGTVSATVQLQGSNDLVGWVSMGTLAAAGPNVGAQTVAMSSTYAYWRAVVADVTAGAVVTVVASTEYGLAGPGTSLLLTVSREAIPVDSGATLELSAGVTYTLTSSVLLPDGVILVGPASGTATIAVANSATINGGTSAVTITAGQVWAAIPRKSNPAAFVAKGT